MANELIKFEHGELIEVQVQRIIEFLELVGLPSDNIIAASTEREIIGKNLPQYLYDLPKEVKQDARYLSKFVIGAGFGLFDYALNSVWNEVVISLRVKAITYGLEIFFDKAVGGTLRESFKKEEDLAGLKDAVLLNTCRKLELISETTYKKLAHILDMRNDIGISHPTNYSINAFELLGWLQTCIQDVLKDKPSEAAIQVKAFIDNLREYDETIDKAKIDSITPQIQSLASHHCDSILRTIFGIYVSRDVENTVRKNISLISPIVWPCASDDEKYKLGIILAGYNNNLHKGKYTQGEEYFNTVKGNSYRPTSEKIIALANLATRLRDAHYGWDNFYYEGPVIERIMTYIEKSSDVSKEVSSDLIKTVLLCRIGKGISYNNGVSDRAKPYYDSFFSILGEQHIPELIIQLTTSEVQVKLSYRIGRQQCIELLTNVRKNIVNARYIESLDYLINNFSKGEKIVFDTQFKKITSVFIKWR
jgi:hypothetical protein